MKKLFLIPLLACLSCVMALGAKVIPTTVSIGQNGVIISSVSDTKNPIKRVIQSDSEEPVYVARTEDGTEYTDVEEAIFASQAGATVEILADVAKIEGYAMAIDRNITIKGNGHKIMNQVLIYADNITLTLEGVTFEYDGVVFYNYAGANNFTITAKAGTNNTVKQTSNTVGFYINNANTTFTLNGTGNLTIDAPIPFFTVGNVVIDNPNLTLKAYSASYLFYNVTTVTLHAGKYQYDPSNYLSSVYYVSKSGSLYQVQAIGSNVAVSNYVAYTSLSAAVSAASDGDIIYMYKNDASAVTVSKNITIKTNGYTTNLSAGTGYSRANVGQDIVFTNNALAAFLMADGTASYTVSSNTDITNVGAIHVKGNKTLTINAGAKVTYKRQGSYANIVVDNGATLTLLGSGTFVPQMHSATRTINGFTAEISATSTDQIGNRAIDVSGELIVGVLDDANNCPHFITSSIARGPAITTNPDGVAILNNANVLAAMAAIWNDGSLTINGGEYKSIATSQNGINGGFYSYALRIEDGSSLVINGGHFVGTHGAVAVSGGAIAEINGGSFETVHGHNWSTGAANAKDNYYALFVATQAIVNVHGGQFKVETPSAGNNQVVLIGDNDAGTTFGIINLYGGLFQQKPYLSHRKAQDAEMIYPASIPTTSQWYSSFGTNVPIPAGYEYYETGNDEYPYGVRAIDGKTTNTIETTEETIAWQESTTWAEDEVPTENTIVTIPTGKNVVVSSEETETTASADQLFINQGATVTVQEGTTLNIGDGGLNVGNGGKLIIEEGATVSIGAAGLITTENEALVVKASEDKQGVVLFAPDVTENTQPHAKVQFISKSYIEGTTQVFQYMGQPMYGGQIDSITAEPTTNAVGMQRWTGSAWDEIGYINHSGTQANDNLDKFVNNDFGFYCIQSNNTSDNLTTITFYGNANGNSNKDVTILHNWTALSNGYLGRVDVEQILEALTANGVQNVIYQPNVQDNVLQWTAYGLPSDPVYAGTDRTVAEIDPMKPMMFHNTGSPFTFTLNYKDLVWDPAMEPSSAPARANQLTDITTAMVTMSGNGRSDKVILAQSADFNADFDQQDAPKYMNGSFNFYVNDAQKLEVLTTDNVDNTYLGYHVTEAGEYTLTFSGIKGEELVLIDLVNHTQMNIVEGATYIFDVEANQTIDNRFQVRAISKIATAIEGVEPATAMQKTGVYNMVGQYMGESINDLPAGIYVVDGQKVIK